MPEIRVNIFLKHISIEDLLSVPLDSSFFKDLFQFTTFLSCLCQLHKIGISNFLALCGLCKAEISWVIHKGVGKQLWTLPAVSAFCLQHRNVTGPTLVKETSTRRIQQKVLGFFSHEKIHKISFWKEESVTAADMIVKWIIQSRSSSASILLGCLSWFSMYELYASAHHKTPGTGGWKKKIIKSHRSQSPTFSVLPNLNKQKKRKQMSPWTVIVFLDYFHQEINACSVLQITSWHIAFFWKLTQTTDIY